MSAEYTGIPYFPFHANFFESDVMELMEAKFGIRSSCMIIKLLCKIYKEGYFIPWGKEQCIIFLRKTGGEIKEETMNQIIELLFEKEFFDKDSYVQHGILTSESIQKVWLEATVRRKRDFSKLPYLLITNNSENPENVEQKGGLKGQDASIFSTQKKSSSENDDNPRQTKLNKTKADTEEEISDASFLIPAYAYSKTTHNLTGLIESLEHHKIVDLKDQQAILRLSDFGRKETPVWKLLLSTNWSKIGSPGKYLISALSGGRKRSD